MSVHNKIDSCFEQLKSENKKALIAFLTAGDPDACESAKAFDHVLSSGADIIEIGMPFSDPMADGPAIQAANIRALEAGQTMEKTLALSTELHAKHPEKPIVLMGYMNPIHHYGLEGFVRDAKAAGVDGLIIVDCPPEENEELYAYCQTAGIHLIHLVTPTTDEARLEVILQRASGFVYCVAIAGITGTQTAVLADVQAKVEMVQGMSDLPVVAGFGIKTSDDAANFSAFCDGVVVGSALVDALSQSHDKLRTLTQDMKEAI